MSKEVRALRAKSKKGDTPKFPYVEFLALKFHYKPAAVEGEEEFEEKKETVYRNVTSDPNSRIESIQQYVKKGWRIVGYGNLEHPKYKDLREHIDNILTERREVEAEARGEAVAPRGRPAPVEVSHGGTAEDAGAPPPASKGEKGKAKDGGREAQV